MLCSHYKHWFKSVHPITQQPITCRHCYANQEDSRLVYDEPEFDRFSVTHVQCVFCKCYQKASASCVNPECTMHQRKHRYYCATCHLWEDDQTKDIFHCVDCGICRVGKREDYVHCDKCRMCVPKNSDHKCVGGLARDNPCPICYTDVSRSADPAVFLQCGHAVHLTCLNEWKRHGGVLAWWYTGCPVCRQR